MTDLNLTILSLLAVSIFVALLLIKAWRHNRNLALLPIRIHVAGTRGKTTTVNLIAAAMRANGTRTAAKTTGSEPIYIGVDGKEEAWARRGPPTIREQAKVIAKAVQQRAEALVVECMAIRPEYIWASERYFIKANIAVITNAWMDHLEEIGSDPEAAAKALRWVIPTDGVLIVSQEAVSEELIALACLKGTSIVKVDVENMTAAQAGKCFALAVCKVLGISGAVALPAMNAVAARLDGVFDCHVGDGEKHIRFVDAFSCNDVKSLSIMWHGAHDNGTRVVLLNARSDRPLRTKSFVEFFGALTPPPIVFVVGDPLAFRIARSGLPGSALTRRLKSKTPAAALEELGAASLSGGSVWGVGNYRGFGSRMIAELRQRSALC